RPRPLIHRQLCQVTIPEANRPGVGPHEADHDRKGRGLACAVGPQQPHDFSARNLQRPAFDNGAPAVSLYQAFGDQPRAGKRPFWRKTHELRVVRWIVSVLPPSGAVTSTLRPRSVIVKTAPAIRFPWPSITHAGEPSRIVRPSLV